VKALQNVNEFYGKRVLYRNGLPSSLMRKSRATDLMKTWR
jgi:hypothetical protein